MGIGAILLQGEGVKERVVAYWSQKLSSTQRKYQTTVRECLAVITAIDKYRPFIKGSRFTVITDHAFLLWLQSFKDPAGRLGRWALRLEAHDFELKHKKIKFMVVTDALSRAVESVEVPDSTSSSVIDQWYDKLRSKVDGNSIYKYCTKSSRNRFYNLEWRLVVPRCDRLSVLKSNHDDPLCSHGGYFKTSDRVKRKYYWPSMDSDIRKYVNNCEACKAAKPTNQIQKSPMEKFRESNRPWEIIYTDFIGPLLRSTSGFSYLLVGVHGFSKFVHMHPLRSATARATIKCLGEHVFLVFGVPRYLVSDNGSQFLSSEFKSFLKRYKVTSWYTSNYHPKANATEGANKTAETAIRLYLKDEKNHKSWDRTLAKIACAMNTSRHTPTLRSPYFVNFGMHMYTSGEDYTLDWADPSQENDRLDN